MKVQFTDLDEFLTELRLAPPNVEPILRATIHSQLDPQTGVFRHLTVIATYLRHPGAEAASPLAVRLECYAGADWGPGFEHGQQARKRADEVLAGLRAGAVELGFEVRAGLYEP